MKTGGRGGKVFGQGDGGGKLWRMKTQSAECRRTKTKARILEETRGRKTRNGGGRAYLSTTPAKSKITLEFEKRLSEKEARPFLKRRDKKKRFTNHKSKLSTKVTSNILGETLHQSLL